MRELRLRDGDRVQLAPGNEAAVPSLLFLAAGRSTLGRLTRAGTLVLAGGAGTILLLLLSGILQTPVRGSLAPVRGPVLDATDNARRYLALLRVDKKAEAGAIRFVLIDGPGRGCMRRAECALVPGVIDRCRAA